MARSRVIKPGFFENKTLAECNAHARLLFIWLWMEADRDGRLKYTEFGLHGKAFQHEPDLDIKAMLDELEKAEFIVRYSDTNGRYIEVINFKKHQYIHKDEKSNNIPKRKEL